MSPDRRSRVTRYLGAVVGGGFLLLGVAELVTRLDDLLTLFFWLPTLWGGGILVLLGVFRVTRDPRLAAALVAVGTTAGLLASAPVGRLMTVTGARFEVGVWQPSDVVFTK